MTNLRIENLTPFVPAKDFDLSSRFYKDLGFAEIASIISAMRFERNGYGFWLQDYYVEDWAGGTARILAEPHAQEGGQMMQRADPSGVLWHIRQD